MRGLASRSLLFGMRGEFRGQAGEEDEEGWFGEALRNEGTEGD